jgi:hypothetical protein
MIIAEQIGNQDMINLSKQEYTCAQDAAKSLNKGLLECVSRDGKFKDRVGVGINPTADAAKILAENLPAENDRRPEFRNLRISLGWLSNGDTTTTPVPQPAKVAEVPLLGQSNGKYRSFVNQPLRGLPFYFAGVGPSSNLVSAGYFQAPDGKRISSIVMVEAAVSQDPLWGAAGGDVTRAFVHSIGCAQPYSLPDTCPPSILAVSFPEGKSRNINCFNDIFNVDDAATLNCHMNQIVGGDYPNHGGSLATGALLSGKTDPNVGQMFGETSDLLRRR